MDANGNASAKDVLTDISTEMSEQGWETAGVNGSDRDRFAFTHITLPNGQQFKVQIEEVF